jgi:hypothetical protein
VFATCLTLHIFVIKKIDMQNSKKMNSEIVKKLIRIENLIKKQSAKRKFKKTVKKGLINFENILTAYI